MILYQCQLKLVSDLICWNFNLKISFIIIYDLIEISYRFRINLYKADENGTKRNTSIGHRHHKYKGFTF
ncbi:MAG: hypothetical protein BAJALOKI3v1_160024 [Promethearchaeota archaeon]|nr:MAG: hypothetical protein BAJALOKI3v1_160024 [Candidatus Lokiarchaeota archaeon]